MKQKTTFIADDGTEFETKKECYAHDGWHKCPVCHGVGHVKTSYNAYPSGFPDSGWVDDIQYKDVSCTVCYGNGFTQSRLVPQVQILGYVKAEDYGPAIKKFEGVIGDGSGRSFKL